MGERLLIQRLGRQVDAAGLGDGASLGSADIPGAVRSSSSSYALGVCPMSSQPGRGRHCHDDDARA
jgi:hypothetical protein